MRQKNRPTAMRTATAAHGEPDREDAAEREASGGEEVDRLLRELGQVELASVGQEEEEEARRVRAGVPLRVGDQRPELAEHALRLHGTAGVGEPAPRPPAAPGRVAAIGAVSVRCRAKGDLDAEESADRVGRLGRTPAQASGRGLRRHPARRRLRGGGVGHPRRVQGPEARRPRPDHPGLDDGRDQQGAGGPRDRGCGQRHRALPAATAACATRSAKRSSGSS